MLVAAIKIAGVRCGLPDLKVGSLHVGWNRIYDILQGPFSRRHPELYRGGYTIDHNASNAGAMRADTYVKPQMKRSEISHVCP